MFDFGSLFGGIASGAMSAASSNRAVKKQIAWERERAQNAHQWEVEDLKKAGLNPILSAGGSGAVTGGISAPVADWSGLAGISAASSAASEARTRKKAQKAQERLQNAEVKQAEQQTKNLGIQNKILQAEAEVAKATSATKTTEATKRLKFLKSKLGSGLYYTGQGVNEIGGALVGGIIGGGLGLGASALKASKAAKAAQSAAFAKKISLTGHERNLFITPNGIIAK